MTSLNTITFQSFVGSLVFTHDRYILHTFTYVTCVFSIAISGWPGFTDISDIFQYTEVLRRTIRKKSWFTYSVLSICLYII